MVVRSLLDGAMKKFMILEHVNSKARITKHNPHTREPAKFAADTSSPTAPNFVTHRSTHLFSHLFTLATRTKVSTTRVSHRLRLKGYKCYLSYRGACEPQRAACECVSVSVCECECVCVCDDMDENATRSSCEREGVRLAADHLLTRTR